MIRYATLFIITMLSLALLGCNGDHHRKQIEKRIAQIKARPPQLIEPLPAIKPMEKVTYQGHHLRNPFLKPYQKKITERQPDLKRSKEALEAFPLDRLKIVGTITQNGNIWALIKEPNDTIHPVTIGNYIGQHLGRITKITSQGLKLVESIQQAGQWQRRRSSLKLDEN